MAAFDLSESAVIRAFNSYGVDGLIARKRPGRTPVMTDEQKGQVLEEFEEPGPEDLLNRRLPWPYSRDGMLLQHGRTEGVRPQPWPEELREKFLIRLRTLAEDELWYSDETGIDGEARPRRGWAIKGSKPRVVHNGDHVRLNILGTVCPRTGERSKPLRYGCLPGLP